MTRHHSWAPVYALMIVVMFYFGTYIGSRQVHCQDKTVVYYHAAPAPFKKAESICRKNLSTASALVFMFDPPAVWQVQCWNEKVYDLTGNVVWHP